MFPFELIRGELYYYLFLIYQLFITFKIFKLISKEIKGRNTKTQQAALCIYCGFLLGSALFEPDFGSWVRHESVTFPILAAGFLNAKPHNKKKGLFINEQRRKSGFRFKTENE